MEEMSLSEIHEETLRLYSVVKNLCEELNIDCFVTYGTLIGAVRHKGYIPWDDDFDLLMKRPDYDKFLNYCKSHDLGHFSICDGFEDHEQGFTISRFCDMRYRYVGLDGVENKKLGLFIDVYPLDGVGNTKKDIEYVRKYKRKYVKLLNLAYSNKFVDLKKGVLYGIGRSFAYVYAHIIGVNRLILKLDRLRKKFNYNSDKYVDVVIWDYKIKGYEKQWFEDKVDLEFENITVECPKEFDKVLKCGYGDYMKLPPKEEQKSYHQYKIYRKALNE